MIKHCTWWLIGMGAGILALLAHGHRLGWRRLLALAIIWAVAADSEARAIMRTCRGIVQWAYDLDSQPTGFAWPSTSPWLVLTVQLLVAAGLLALALKDRRSR